MPKATSLALCSWGWPQRLLISLASHRRVRPLVWPQRLVVTKTAHEYLCLGFACKWGCTIPVKYKLIRLCRWVKILKTAVKQWETWAVNVANHRGYILMMIWWYQPQACIWHLLFNDSLSGCETKENVKVESPCIIFKVYLRFCESNVDMEEKYSTNEVCTSFAVKINKCKSGLNWG